MIVKVNPQNPQRRAIRRVVEILQKGGVIAYPTDTIYGLGCNLFHKDAIERIYRLKRHSKSKRLSIICSDLKDISRYAQAVSYTHLTLPTKA